MPEQLQKIVQPVKSRWDALTKDQKIKLVAAIAVVLTALALTLYFLLRTDYDVMFRNSDRVTLADYKDVLDDAGIKSRFENDGTALAVDKNFVGQAHVEIQRNPATAGGGLQFEDAISMLGMGTTTDTAKRVMIREHESKLNNELAYFDGVNSAVVTLIIPDAMRLFISDAEESRASVIIDASQVLTKEEGLAMANHLRASVEGLELENISIHDQDYNIVYSGAQEEASRSVEGTVAEVKAMEKDAVINKLRSAYSRMYHDVEIAPNLVYNEVALTEEVRQEYFIPEGAESGLPLTQSDSSFSGENYAQGDVPGTDTNIQEQQTYQQGADGNQSFEQEERNTEYAYDVVHTTQTMGPGSFIRDASTLTIYLYRFHTYFQELLMQDDPEFSAADWNEQVANTPARYINDEVVNLTQIIQEASTATGIPVENITVSIWEIPAFEPYTETPVDIALIIALSLLGLLLLMLAYALIRRQKLAEEEEEAEPELSVEDLLVSTQLEEAKEEAEKLEEIDYAKESEIKKQIEKFVNEKPEAVAALLRNWLNTEEW